MSLAGSVLSLSGAALLLLKPSLAQRWTRGITSFAAGTMLATSFLDLLPEALERASASKVLAIALGGFLIFFVIEHSVAWFHIHHEFEDGDRSHRDVAVPLIIVSDTVHNFIDGIVIASAFLISPKAGIITSLAIAAHEIPQEIGDFGILLARGVSPRRTLAVNLLSATATLFAAVSTYYLGRGAAGLMPVMISLTAGFFIYIAASDLIPELRHHRSRARPFSDVALLFAGVAIITLFVALLD